MRLIIACATMLATLTHAVAMPVANLSEFPLELKIALQELHQPNGNVYGVDEVRHTPRPLGLDALLQEQLSNCRASGPILSRTVLWTIYIWPSAPKGGVGVSRGLPSVIKTSTLGGKTSSTSV